MAAVDHSKIGSTGFKKGAFQAHIKVVPMHNLDEIGSFTHDVDCFNDFADALAVRAYEKLATMREDADDGVVREGLRKMLHLGQAKKLSVSFPAEEEHFRGGFSGIAKAEVVMPSIAIPILEGFGPVENKDEKFRMSGQAAVLWTHLGRALALGAEECLGVQQNTVGEDVLYVGRGEQTQQAMVDYCVAEINSWVQTAPSFQLQVGADPAQICEIKPPKFARGATAWRALIMGCGGRTAWLERMLRIVEIFEVGGPFNADTVRALNANGPRVVVLDWTRAVFSLRMEEYIRRVQNPLRTVLSALGIYSVMKGASGVGESWQLATIGTDSMVYTPHSIAPGAIEKGWMTVGRDVGVEVGHEKWMYNGNRTRREAINAFLDGTLKG